MLSRYVQVDRTFNFNDYDWTNHTSAGLAWDFVNLALESISLSRFNKTILRSMQEDGGCYHFLYPETMLSKFNYEVPANTKIIATFHQTPEWYEKLTKDPGKKQIIANLRKTDHAIALIESQVYPLMGLLGHDRVEVIHHGVAREYFKPDFASSRLKYILVIGRWMRDLAFVKAVAEEMFHIHPEATFQIVGTKDDEKIFKGNPNVEYYSDLSEDEVNSLYCFASLMFMPLKAPVANNTLLQAMACGLPLMVSNFLDIREYTDGAGVLYFDHSDPVSVCNQMVEVLNDSKLQKELALDSAEHSLNFDWPLIGEKVEKVYEQVLD